MSLNPPPSQSGAAAASEPEREALFCRTQLKRNSLWGILRFSATIVLFAVSYRVYLNYLHLELFGLWILFTTLVFYLQQGAFNLPQAVAKLVSECLARGERLAIRRYAVTALAAVAAAGLAAFALIYFARDLFALLLPLPPAIKPQLLGFLLLTAALTCQVMLAETLGGVIAGLGRMDWSYQLELLRQILTFGLAVALLSQGLGLAALFASHILGYLAGVLVAALLIRRCLGTGWWQRSLVSWPHLKELFRLATPLAGGSLINLLLQPFNRLLLGYAVSLPAVSVYDIADRTAQTVRAPVEAALRPYMPQMSGLAAQEDTARIRRMTFHLIRMVILWATPFFIIMFISADQVLRLWLGNLASPEISLNLRIIMWGYFVNMLSIPVYNAFLGLGQVEKCFKIHFLQTFFNVIFALFGIIFFREVWVISSAVTVALTLAAIHMMVNFMTQQGEVLKRCWSGIKVLIIPVIVFLPLFLLYEHFTYFIVATVLISSIYFLIIANISRRLEPV